MKSYPFAAARVFGVPLAIHPVRGFAIAQALANIIVFGDGAQAGDGVTVEVDEPERSYEVVRGVAVIPVAGTLVHKSSWMDAMCGIRGYDAIRAEFGQAMNDPDVRAVCLAIDSPGGEVAGCFDLVDFMYGYRGEKPIWSIIEDQCYSAGFAIGSVADRIVLPRTGGNGHVGVITMHADFSRALDADGIKIEIITYGKHKADGNPYEPLPSAVRARLQADVDTMGELFVETAARNLGLPVAKVKATQALTYMGAQSVDVGFAHAVMAPDEAFRALLTELG